MMKKIMILLLSFSVLTYAQEAYAIMDMVGKVESVLEELEKYYKQAEEEIKKVEDIEKRARQGYDEVKGCAANPLNCANSNVLNKLKNAFPDSEEMINDYRSISGEDGDVINKDAEKLETAVKNTEYQRGVSNAIQVVAENREKNNAVATDNVAILFAKGAVTRQSILNEDNDIYQRKFENDNLEEILKAQSVVEILSNYRISRILEMRAYMNSGESVAGLTQHTRDSEE